ncbi:MAG: nuclear transport factor 2 family protein [Salibacteraceae bacterium]
MINTKNLKKLLLFTLLALIAIACKQAPETDAKGTIVNHMRSMDTALMEQDTLRLATLLHDDLTLGHSNGWMETKPGLLETLVQGGVVYRSIRSEGSPAFHYQSDNLITTRRDLDVEGVVNETPFSVKLNVLEVWILEDSNWQLFARQSVNRKE